MTRIRTPLTTAVLLAVLSAASSAQTVLVRAQSSATSTPVFGALAYLVGPGGETVRNALTDERGRALFVGIPAGSYRVRVEMIGLATAETEPFAVAEGLSVTRDLLLESSAIQLEGIEVEADGGRCRLRPTGEGLTIATVWDEARKALTAAALTDEQGIYRYETVRYDRRLDRNLTVLDEQETRRDAYMATPFESRPAEELVSEGFVQTDGPEHLYFAPDAEVLLSDVFLDTHCFRLARPSDAESGVIGLGFEPTGENRHVPDIRGTLWLDEETAELRWLDFTYDNLPEGARSAEVGGRVAFERLPAGTWIVPEWWIRMPALAERRNQLGRPERYIDGFHQTGGVVVDVHEAGGRSLGQRVETGAFEGVVIDSVGVIRQGVRVFVVGSNQEVYTDPEGRYSITGLRPGRYQVQFIDPHLEAVGFVPPPVVREAIRGQATPLDYHMPSIGDVLFEACRDEERIEGSGILAGVIRDGRGIPLPGATVEVRWERYIIPTPYDNARLEGIETNGYRATADSRGFYRFCSVPVDRLLFVSGAWRQGEDDVRSADYETRIEPHEVAQLQIVVIER